MNRILLGILIIGLANLACGVESSTPVAVPQYPTLIPLPPKYGPTVSPNMVTATRVVSILTENGFVQIPCAELPKDACDQSNLSNSYINPEHDFFVGISANGCVSYLALINSPGVGGIMDTLMFEVYGYDVDSWVYYHTGPPLSSLQTSTVGGFDLTEQYFPANGNISPVIGVTVCH